VAGTRLSTTVESATLAAEDHRLLRSLLEASDLTSTRPTRGPGAPDRLQYHVTVEDDGKTVELRLAENDVPEALRPLLDWLTERARRLRHA